MTEIITYAARPAPAEIAGVRRLRAAPGPGR